MGHLYGSTKLWRLGSVSQMIGGVRESSIKKAIFEGENKEQDQGDNFEVRLHLKGQRKKEQQK